MAEDQFWSQRIEIENKRRKVFIDELISPPLSSQASFNKRDFQNHFSKPVKHKLHAFVPGLYLKPHQRFANVNSINSTYYNASDPNTMRNFGKAHLHGQDFLQKLTQSKKQNQAESQQVPNSLHVSNHEQVVQQTRAKKESREINLQSHFLKHRERKQNQDNTREGNKLENISVYSSKSKESSYLSYPKKYESNKTFGSTWINASVQKNKQRFKIEQDNQLIAESKTKLAQGNNLGSSQNSLKFLTSSSLKKISTFKPQDFISQTENNQHRAREEKLYPLTTRNEKSKKYENPLSDQQTLQSQNKPIDNAQSNPFRLLKESKVKQDSAQKISPKTKDRIETAFQKQMQKYKKYKNLKESDLQILFKSPQNFFLKNKDLKDRFTADQYEYFLANMNKKDSSIQQLIDKSQENSQSSISKSFLQQQKAEAKNINENDFKQVKNQLYISFIEPKNGSAQNSKDSQKKLFKDDQDKLHLTKEASKTTEDCQNSKKVTKSKKKQKQT